MIDRRSVLLLFFDIPSKTKEEHREYSKFRKTVIAEGYIQLQESVYVKLIHNTSLKLHDEAVLKSVSPAGSNVMLLPLSLREFQKVSFICGNEFDLASFSDDIVYF